MKTTLLILLLGLTPFAHSADKLIFACTNAQGKQVRVTEHAGKFRYQFGKPNRPELVFENQRQEAIDRSPMWNGVGNLWSNLVLANGDYRYSVFKSMDRNSDEHPIEYGVTVEQIIDGESKYINQIQCSKKYEIVENLPEEVLF